MKTLLLALVALGAFAQTARKPETVMITCHAKPGAAADLQRALDRHWTTIRDLKLVTAAPHVRLKGVDAAGTVYFVDIFTWRDESIPDHAPEAVQTIWSELNRLATVDIAEVQPW
jgi:hypothetical protein